MADLEAAIYSRLAGFAALTALLGTYGTPAQPSIFPKRLPQGTNLPAVLFQRIAGPRVSAMGADPGLAYPTIEVQCWARDVTGKTAYRQAKDVMVQIRAALQRFRGTVAGVVIQDVLILGQGDRDLDSPDEEIRGVAIDFRVWHQES